MRNKSDNFLGHLKVQTSRLFFATRIKWNCHINSEWRIFILFEKQKFDHEKITKWGDFVWKSSDMYIAYDKYVKRWREGRVMGGITINDGWMCIYTLKRTE